MSYILVTSSVSLVNVHCISNHIISYYIFCDVSYDQLVMKTHEFQYFLGKLIYSIYKMHFQRLIDLTSSVRLLPFNVCFVYSINGSTVKYFCTCI